MRSCGDNTMGEPRALLPLKHLNGGYIYALSPPLSCPPLPTFFPCSVTGALSFNAAMVAAVILASRFSSPLHVFFFVILAIQLFALFPMARDFLRTRSETAHLVLTCIMSVTTFVLLMSCYKLLAVCYLLVVVFIALGCPVWMLYLQKYKKEIKGPWDEASVTQFRT